MVQNNNSLNELSIFIRKINHQCIVANTCKMALDQFERNADIDLMVIDISVSDNHGLDLVKYAKSHLKHEKIPVILTSSNWDKESVIESAKLNVNEILTLPFNEESVMSKINAALKAGRQTILVVDDEPEIRDLLKRILEMERFFALTASSAEEAIEILGENRVHAIISDIMLPNMSGIDLIKVVRDNYGGLPVILITGYGGQFTPKVILNTGANGYFMKPFGNLELLSRLKIILAANPILEKA